MHPEPDPRTYVPPLTRHRIGRALEAITEAYDDQRAFMDALRNVPGTHGIRDIYVASDSITYRENGPSILTLGVIVETEPGIGQEDARSWVTSALDGYVGGERRITYDFATFEARPPTALVSVAQMRRHPERKRGWIDRSLSTVVNSR